MTTFNIHRHVHKVLGGIRMRLRSLNTALVGLIAIPMLLLLVEPLSGYGQSDRPASTSKSSADGKYAAGSTASAATTSIHNIDFRNFRYPSGCSKDDPSYPLSVHVINGKWERGKEGDDDYKDYEVQSPRYARLLGTNDEQAVIVASCFLGNWSDTEVFVYGMDHGKPMLIQRLTDSDWAPEGCWIETVTPEVKNNRLVISFMSGGFHAQPDWDVTATMKWNGSKFVSNKTVKTRFKP
jgi:hypothetical protein